MSLKSDSIQFFHDLVYVYSPGAGADSPQGTNRPVARYGLPPPRGNFVDHDTM